jgi:hypothetical protein
MKRYGTVGVVGAGPAGLFLAHLLSPHADVVYVFEAGDRVGGRTRMGEVGGVHVVTGAGIVRKRDKILRRLARYFDVSLRRFETKIQYAFDNVVPLNDLLRAIQKKSGLFRRSETFRQNIERIFGRDFLKTFMENAGQTDYLDADIIDTLDDYGFQDNTSGQVMFQIDWDLLMDRMRLSLPSNVRVFLNTPITYVRRRKGQFILQKRWSVDAIFWTAPRPSWKHLSPILSSDPKWTHILDGVSCQPFIRSYARPKDPQKALRLYPSTTFLPINNPLQRILPYKDGLYMVSYADNQHAVSTHTHITNKKWLSHTSGLEWATRPVSYFHRCGTHFYTPLDTTIWDDRDSFLVDAQHPAPNIYMCGEGLSRQQGWTEGALASCLAVVSLLG